MSVEVDPRTKHYGVFYGLEDLPDRPFAVIHGNCQAEALRVALEAADAEGPFCVRVPAVHELVENDVPHLQRVYGAASILVTQPVRDGFRGLPVGSQEVEALLGQDATTVRIPVLWWSSLHPYQFLSRNAEVPDPPLVPYHDLRTVARAADLPVPEFTDDQLRAVANGTATELRRREEEFKALRGDDLFEKAGSRATNTVNHPGNPVLLGMAGRILDELGSPESAVDPGRELLRSIFTPIEERTLVALEIDGEPREQWVLDGRPTPREEVDQVHRDWLQQHPAALTLAVETARRRCSDLGVTL